MDEFRFWEIIQLASSRVTAGPDGFGKELRALLKEELLQLRPDDIMMFRRLFDQRIDLACSIVFGERPTSSTAGAPTMASTTLDGDWSVFASYASAVEEAWGERSGRGCEEFNRKLETLGRLPAENGEDKDDY